ncbi:ComF family protein [bacterium]|nr:ComF family protein [bacterium]
MWKTLLKNSIDLLFPRRCINCNRVGSSLCQDCLALIEILSENYCPFCTNPTFGVWGKTCQNCRKNHYLGGLIAAVSYNQPLVKKAIIYFKYPPFLKDLKKSLVSLIIAYLSLANNNFYRNFSDYFFVPIPSYKSRLRFREFSHTLALAEELSKSLKLPLKKDLVIQHKKTQPQAELSKELRIKNVKGVFSINPQFIKFVENKKFILVDDVFTTGSTMDEVAKLLKENGAKEVWGMVVAREF